MGPVDQTGPLHAAILAADPRDDLEPLVFADWLEEQGRIAQAEFLRVQRKLMVLSPEDPQARKLRERRAELFQSVRTWYDFPAEWYSSNTLRRRGRPRYYIPHWLELIVLDLNQYLLGFVSAATIDYKYFMELVEPLTRFQPVLNLTLLLQTIPGDWSEPEILQQIAESPLLVHVTNLVVRDLAHEVVTVLKSPYLTRLRRIDTIGLPADLVQAILESPANFELEVLDAEVGTAWNGRQIFQMLADSPRMRKLRHLITRGSPMGPAEMMILRNSPNLKLAGEQWAFPEDASQRLDEGSERPDEEISTAHDWDGGGLPLGPTTEAYQRLIAEIRDRCGIEKPG